MLAFRGRDDHVGSSKRKSQTVSPRSSPVDAGLDPLHEVDVEILSLCACATYFCCLDRHLVGVCHSRIGVIWG